MADLSESFKPGDIATASDAASDATSKVATVSDVASSAQSKVARRLSATAFSGLAKITVGLSAPVAPSVGDLWIDTSSTISNTISDAISKVAAVSDVASNALSKATAGSQAASDAVSKVATVSDAASDALSKVAVVSNAASAALSRANTVSDAASKAGARTVILKIYNEASAISSGDGKMYFTVPAVLNGMNLTSVGGHLYTAATSGVVAVQVANVTSGVDMLSTAKKLEWDATEKDTATAAAGSAVVINTANDGVATGEEIRIDIDDAASGAKGMEIRMTFRTP
jgi:hypothetical protein